MIYECVDKQFIYIYLLVVSEFYKPDFGKTRQHVCLQKLWSQFSPSMINVPQAHISNSASHFALRVTLSPLSYVLIALNYVMLLLQQIVARRNAILKYKMLYLIFQI